MLTVNARVAMCLQPEFDQISISVLDPKGTLSTWGQDGELAGVFDQLQYGLGEGPCHDSLLAADCVVVSHLRHDRRWRRYVAQAAALGLRSQVSAPLRWRNEPPLGTLNMYSTTHVDIGVTSHLVAQVVAAQVANALAAFREIHHLHAALDSSTILGQATGVVMTRLEIDADHASAHLRRVSMLRNETLAQVAQDLVCTRRMPTVPPD